MLDGLADFEFYSEAFFRAVGHVSWRCCTMEFCIDSISDQFSVPSAEHFLASRKDLQQSVCIPYTSMTTEVLRNNT
jgi:hypothetical protein